MAAHPHFYCLGVAVCGSTDAGGVRVAVSVTQLGAALNHAVGADRRLHPGGEQQLSGQRRAAEVRRRGEARGAVRVSLVGRRVKGQQLKERGRGKQEKALWKAKMMASVAAWRTCGDGELDVTEPS